MKKPKPAADRAALGAPSNFVVSTLTSERNPLIGITLIGEATAAGFPYSRAMGFITERYENGIRLALTCRHVLAQLGVSREVHTIFTQNPVPRGLELLGQPIYDPLAESDIAFMLLRDREDTATAPLHTHSDRLPIHDGLVLYNASNEWDVDRYRIATYQQRTSPRPFRAFGKFSVYEAHVVNRGEVDLESQLRNDGWLEYQALQMQSRHRYSGSPIWDNNFRLYGMNCRGTSPGNGLHQRYGDIAIYLPAKALHEAKQRVTGLIEEQLESWGAK